MQMDIEWHWDGKLRRGDNPSVVSCAANWWYLNGLLHRDNGPAKEYANGYKEWYQYGKRIR